ncbi:MAG TPA: ABC transporter ATP-binding protein, partial [Ktedonobacteraceae bacterium]|nr:ABC transporter ATP-binding protein [Ktedonobacteraceae bacterium]
MAADAKETMGVRIPPASPISLLRTYLKPYRFKVSLLAFLLLGSLGLELLGPQLIGRFIDAVHGSMSVLVDLALLFIGLACIYQLVTALAGYMSEDLTWRATNALRLDLTLHCLSLDMSFHLAHTPGELIERIDGDIVLLAHFFSRFVFSVLNRLLLLIGIVALTLFVDWHIGLLLLAFVGLMVVLRRPLQKLALPHIHAVRQTSAELAGFFGESYASLEDIQSLGAQAYVMFRLNKLARRLLRHTCESRVTGRFFSSATQIGLALASAAVLIVGAYLLRSGQMSLGTIYVTYSYTALLTQNLFTISFQIHHVQRAAASIQRINELYRTPITIGDGPGLALSPGPLAVKFNAVSFGYTAEQPVLRNLSFALPAGKTLGLLGRTGSGKTTLISLLSRTYDIQQGSIQLGGIDIRQATLKELRNRVGVVTQQVQLFHASVRDNLTLFDSSISDDRLEQVIAELNLTRWYASLPHGLDTIIAGTGVTLSSG